MIRNSARFVSYKGLKKAYAGLKAVYSANTEEAGREALEGFGKTWGGKHPVIYQSWERRWDGLSGFFKHPPETAAPFIRLTLMNRLIINCGKLQKTACRFQRMMQY
jgi:transposase-like protein